MKKLVAVGLLFGVLASGCQISNSQRDLEEQQIRDADVVVYRNVDHHPNVARLCTDGVAWFTTTRDFTAIRRMKEWDKFCPEKSRIVFPGVTRGSDTGNDD